MKTPDSLSALLEEFSDRIRNVVQAETMARISGALGASAVRRGRPPKNGFALPGFAAARRPAQLCPVPGCKNPAAPIFGMVCRDHKDLPKADVKKFRAARKAEKAGAKPSAAPTVEALPPAARGRKRRTPPPIK